MTNQDNPEVGDKAAPVDASMSPGAVLQQARESKSLSLESVANVLRISRAKLQALEADQYADMPAEAFVRGYIRAYCKLVDLDEAVLIDRYEEYLAANREVSQLVEPPQLTPVHMLMPILTRFWFVPVLLLAIVVGWMVLQPDPDGGRTDLALPATVPVAVPDNTMSSDAGSTAVTGETDAVENADANVAPAENPALTEVTQAEVPVAVQSTTMRDNVVAGDVLRLVFSDECWLEVSDAKGDVLAADLKQAGDSVELRGTAPFNVMLGNARVANVELNGRPVNTTPSGANRALRIQVE